MPSEPVKPLRVHIPQISATGADPRFPPHVTGPSCGVQKAMLDLGPISTKKDWNQVSHEFHNGASLGSMTLAEYENTVSVKADGLVNVRN